MEEHTHPRATASKVETLHTAVDTGSFMRGIAALIFAIAFTGLVLWVALASPKATAFDADGVRCYHRAITLSCIQTARP